MARNGMGIEAFNLAMALNLENYASNRAKSLVIVN